MEQSIIKQFARYVSLNVLGMIGISLYVLADTFFISKALGAMGMAALNFSIPIFNVIHGTGLMIGIGGATRYSILKSQNKDEKANMVFSICDKLAVLIGVIFVIVGIFASRPLALILGADMSTLAMTKTYLTTILCFAPFFMLNNILLAFVRNDNNPNLSMVAMLIGSCSNIILDYIFIFPLGMGMFGAAFATSLAPIISIGVLSIHFIKKKNNFIYTQSKMVWTSIQDIFSLGLSSFITEIGSAVVLITFNLVILNLRGNVGVAAYGIIANIAFVVIAVFTGIAQGIQPLISKGYGLKKYQILGKVLKLSILTSLSITLIMYFSVFLNASTIVEIFNSEGNLKITQIAAAGLRIYFIGFFFAGINIIIAAYLSATEHPAGAFVISITRGAVIIIPLVLLLSSIWDMTGVWLSFVLTEGSVTIIAIFITTLRREFLSNKKVSINVGNKLHQ